MRQEQDHNLDAWLANYRVTGISASSHQALLDKIVARAKVLPQRRLQIFVLPRRAKGLLQKGTDLAAIARTFIEHRRTWGLVPNAAALVVVALIGFLMGLGSTGTATPVQTAAQQATSTSADYLDQIVFGPKSWKEVSL